MATFKYNWVGTSKIIAKKYICWNCGTFVSSIDGYHTSNFDEYIYICPSCHAPQIVDFFGSTYPNSIQGKLIKKLPEDVEKCYNEARLAFSIGAYTGAVMLFRKILMNLSVVEGAKAGGSFAGYVTYLCDNGFVHKKQIQQAEHLKKLGNDANHQLESRTKEEAEDLLHFVELLLMNNYEFADE